MHDYAEPHKDGGKFTTGARLSPVHQFDLLNTPCGQNVEQTIETAEQYADRTNDGPEE
jgi:hypothetical protein